MNHKDDDWGLFVHPKHTTKVFSDQSQIAWNGTEYADVV
jgi:hypothetical protein